MDQSIQHGLPETNAQDPALIGEGLGEDGVEDGGEVESIDGGGVRSGNDVALLGQSVAMLS